MTRFLLQRRRSDPGIDDYSKLYQWSIEHPQEFWPEVWRFCAIRSSRPWDEVVVDFDRMPGASWFPGARLNFAQNLLSRRDEHPALIFRDEAGRREEWSYRRLGQETRGLASALEACGVGPGDRVAGYMPNRPETVAAMLAASCLGAVWSSCSPDFGVKGVLDRFGQIRPKVLFAAPGYSWNGRPVDCLEKTRRVLEAIESIERTVIVPFGGERPPQIGGLRNACLYSEFLAQSEDEGDGPESLFRQLPFDHPLYILYSSGTTGLPKCMVHSAGGTLIQHLKELVLHCDLRSQDRIFYFTTCGWMMWNWLVSSLAVGATVVLYDGSPFPPEREAILYDVATQENVRIFGVSAKYIALSQKKGLRPRESHDLAPLDSVLSTGSPLAPESFDYVYRDIKPDVRLSSISGGTDLISCFALGNPIAPVHRGELQTAGLGMKVEVWDEQGRPLPVGAKGELVCSAPFPSMPIGFWNDPKGDKYRKAYFERFPGVWRHGDWVERTARGGFVIHGRSDATLNPGGVRIGTAEIYRPVEQMEEVLEGLVVGQEWEDDVRIVLFLRLAREVRLDRALRSKIADRIRFSASPHHVPKRIVQVADIPRTISGKISELAVRNVIHGRPVTNVDALANPESLELFRELPELAQ